MTLEIYLNEMKDLGNMSRGVLECQHDFVEFQQECYMDQDFHFCLDYLLISRFQILGRG